MLPLSPSGLDLCWTDLGARTIQRLELISGEVSQSDLSGLGIIDTAAQGILCMELAMRCQ